MMGIVTMDVSTLMIHPFIDLFGRKRGGWKSKLYPTKDMLIQEIMWAQPDLKVNKSNHKIEEGFALIPKPRDPKDRGGGAHKLKKLSHYCLSVTPTKFFQQPRILASGDMSKKLFSNITTLSGRKRFSWCNYENERNRLRLKKFNIT